MAAQRDVWAGGQACQACGSQQRRARLGAPGHVGRACGGLTGVELCHKVVHGVLAARVHLPVAWELGVGVKEGLRVGRE